MNVRGRKWLITINNPEGHDQCESVDDWKELLESIGTEAYNKITPDYFICQLERGEQGTCHLQGFAEYKNARTFQSLQKKLKCHLQIVSNDNGAAQYCQKEDTRIVGPLSFGTQITTQSKQSLVAQLLFTVPQALDYFTNCQQLIAWKRVKFDPFFHQRDIHTLAKPTGIWIYGPAGVGKSTLARAEDESHYVKPINKWWDGYNFETTVIVDDFAPEHAAEYGYYLKIWADQYPFFAEIKGSTLRIRPLRLIVTSQYSIQECFQDDKTLQALSRRFEQRECPMKLY